MFEINYSDVKKKWFTKSNIITALMMVFVLALLISPQFKVIISQGLMKIGLFQPRIPIRSNEAGSSLTPSTESVRELVFKNENGTKISLSDHKGKVIFINFWTTWCPPCRAEMPSINSLYEKVGKNNKVLFLMVDADNKLTESAKFMKKRSFQLPVVAIASAIPEQIFAGSLPTTLIISPTGEIVFRHEGMADYDNTEIINLINGMLVQ